METPAVNSTTIVIDPAKLLNKTQVSAEYNLPAEKIMIPNPKHIAVKGLSWALGKLTR